MKLVVEKDHNYYQIKPVNNYKEKSDSRYIYMTELCPFSVFFSLCVKNRRHIEHFRFCVGV